MPIWFLYDASKGILGVIPVLFAGAYTLALLVAIGLAFLIAPAVRYARFRYEIQGNTLVIEGGLFSRWRRVIPRERVQSVDVIQKLRHRAFGVLELRIEAVGGKQTEAALVAVLPEEADRIRRWASGGKEEPVHLAAEEMSPPLARLTGRDLLIAGVTGGRVAVLAILIGYAEQFLGDNSFDLVTGAAERLMPGASLIVFIFVLVLVVLALALLLSIALTILTYWDFTVRLEDDRLVITRGLLEKRRAQIPLRRVQAIQVNENFLRRAFDLASLTVVVAGYSSESQEKEESSMLLPLARRDHAWRVATEILGAPVELESAPLPRSPSRAVPRRIIFPSLFGVGAGVVATVLAGPLGAAGFAIVPLAWFLGWLSWRCSGHGVVPGYVLIRSGALVRTTSIVPEANIQHHQLTWSILQKSFRLATVNVHIPGTHRRAADLDEHEALRWFTLLGERGEAGLTGGPG